MAMMITTAPAAMPAPAAIVPGLPNRVSGATASKAPAIARSAKPISATLTPVCLVKANMVIRSLSRSRAILLQLHRIPGGEGAQPAGQF